MNKYEEKKQNIREQAKEYQSTFEKNNYSYADLMYYGNYFYKMGKRYGLLREFKENGIC